MERRFIPVVPEREVIAGPGTLYVNTTALFVTRDPGGKWYIEAADVVDDSATGFARTRVVFHCKNRKEIDAWFAGRAWNPGGVILSPHMEFSYGAWRVKKS